jgi:DNA topoisomerase-1
MPAAEAEAATKVGGARPDGRARWRTLAHAGVVLPPPYVPHGRPVLWAGKEVRLTPEAEEAITAFVRRGGAVVRGRATLLGTEAAARRFWGDWRRMLGEKGKSPIESLGGCDLSRIAEVALLVKRPVVDLGRPKSAPPPPQATAMVDGRPQPVAPYAVDRPGIFSGRNASAALSGRYRRRIEASDVTLNLSRGAPVPAVPFQSKQKWASIVHDPTVDWVAKWRDPVTGVIKYARLSPASSGEQSADRQKYDLARKLHALLPELRKRASAALLNDEAGKRQIGACLWLIDRLALRVGSGSPEQAARDGAHGATTLLAEHAVSTDGGRRLTLDFPGKDGVRYHRTVDDAPPELLRLVQSLSSSKAKGSPLFPLASADAVGDAVSAVLAGATPKVLRTCRASETFERALAEALPPSVVAGSDKGAVELAILLAGARVAALCNHRKGLPLGTIKKGVADLRELDAAIAGLGRELARKWKDPKAVASITRRLSEDVVRPAGLSLATSRASYVDPRIVYAFYSRAGFGKDDRRRYFGTKAIERRFAWAADTPGTFRFTSSASSSSLAAEKSGLKAEGGASYKTIILHGPQ